MARILSHEDRLLQLAELGPFRASELADIQVPRVYLQRLREAGRLVKVDRGLYRLAGGSVRPAIAEVAHKYPRGIVCLLSALAIHGMGDTPAAVWLMVERHARRPRLQSVAIEAVRASGPALMYGVETRQIDGVPVRVTAAAKTVADCWRYRARVGKQTAIAALRAYLRTGSVDALTDAARADKVMAIMEPYLEALAGLQL
jgi:predicted transcriptional regulator of viral defense system